MQSAYRADLSVPKRFIEKGSYHALRFVAMYIAERERDFTEYPTNAGR